MRRARKRMAAALCIAVMGMTLASCAKTPEKSAVVDKSKGLSEEFILPEEKETPKDLKIPARWQETLERSDGFVTVKADCEMEIPEIYNSPVYAYEMQPMTDELLKKLCDYFSEGDRLYEYPKMTRSELEVEKEDMVHLRGRWSSSEESDMRRPLEGLDELIAKAPEERTRTYMEAELRQPYQTEKEYVYEAMGSYAIRNSSYYFQSDETIAMKARIDRGQKVDPLIYAIDYREELGSTSNFLFEQGIYVDESAIEQSLKEQEMFSFSDEYEDYLNDMKKELDEMAEEGFTCEEALKKVDKVLKDLELQGYIVTECEKAIVNPESENWACTAEVFSKKEMGYSVDVLPKAGDLNGYEQPFQQPFTDLPETVYAPAFSTERIHMVVTQGGVQAFEWTNLSRKKGEIAENTKLLNFEEIKEKAADHLLYISMAGNRKNDKKDGYSYVYNVKNVELRAANIPAYEDLTATWLVPVWVFRVDEYWATPQNRTYHFPEKDIVLNAIDGGYVQPRIDPRIPVSQP